MKQRLLLYSMSLFILGKSLCQIPKGEILWLKADQNVVLDVNNKVSEWKDASKNYNNVRQSNPSLQPTWVDNVLGNKPAIFFDGVHGKYYLSNNVTNLTTAGSARTVFIVGLLDSSAVDNGGGDFPSAGGTMFTFRRTAPVFAIQAARINHTVAAKADYVYTAGLGTNSNATTLDRKYYNTSKRCEFVDVFISSGAGSYLRVKQDGDSVAVNQTNSIVGDYGATGFTVGDREDFSGQDWQGYIAEVIVYDRELTKDEITQTELYLLYRYHPPCVNPFNNDDNARNQTNPLDIVVAPNPVISNLFISGLPKTSVHLTITDLAGIVWARAEVNNSATYVWNMSKLKKGSYILKAQFEGGVITKKLLKQ